MPETTFTYQTKNITSWDMGVEFLLQEMGSFLLLEDGYKIVLNQSENYREVTNWNNQIKN